MGKPTAELEPNLGASDILNFFQASAKATNGLAKTTEGLVKTTVELVKSTAELKFTAKQQQQNIDKLFQ